MECPTIIDSYLRDGKIMLMAGPFCTSVIYKTLML